MIWLHPG